MNTAIRSSALAADDERNETRKHRYLHKFLGSAVVSLVRENENGRKNRGKGCSRDIEE